ncbi:MAG: flagellar basal-body rod protein FlgG [Pirellulales bacterium]
MSIQTLYTAATGMTAMESKLNVVANNLANINTTGFKKGRANFEDLFYRHEVLPGAVDAAGNLTATGTSIGLGTKVSSVQTDFRQGEFNITNAPLDWAVEGDGFFQVADSDGTLIYTRAGNFSLNATGDVVMGSASTGRKLDPPIQIPPDATDISVSPEGIVSVKQPGQSALSQVGQLQLATFVNSEGLLKLGENLYAETEASGTATIGNPGVQGVGRVRQGTLEISNVQPVQELIDLITTQRSFELNSQAVQAGDQMLQLVANLRRF